MVAPIPPGTTINANVVRDLLARIDLAVADICQEVAELPQRAANAGRSLVACVSKAATLRGEFGDLTKLSNGGAQDIANLARILEEILEKVQHITRISKTWRRYRWWESPEAKIEKYRKRVEEAILRLSPLIDSLTVNEPQPSISPQINSALNISPPPPPPRDPSPIPSPPPTWTTVIGPSRSALKAVAAVTPLIPVVGQFIQYGIDVGHGLLDMLDGMSQNDERTSALSERVSQLSNLVAGFKDTTKTYATSKQLITCLEDFQTQCNSIQKEADSLKSQAGFGKFIFSQENAGTLSKLYRKIDEALKALSLYSDLNAQHVQQIQERDRLLDRLGDASFGDIGNASEDGLCFKDTRAEILERIDGWTVNTFSAKRVLWLRGQAGRGKSTIARTVMSRFTKKFKESGSSAVFHFRRGNETLNKRIVLALARQIARCEDEPVSEIILQAIREHQDVAQSRPEDQFKSLIVEPLKKLGEKAPPILFVIDALDECGDRNLVHTLLRLVNDHSPSLLTVRFLITSRPEPHIIDAFHKLPHTPEDLDMGDREGDTIEHDLRAYYTKRLEQIKGLEDQWKRRNAVEELVKRSERLFQWAHTAMNYIEQSTTPHIRLRKIIEDKIDVNGLNRLYTEILSEAFPLNGSKDPSLLELLRHVLGSLALSPHPISLSVLRYLYYDSSDPTICSEREEEIHGEVLCLLRSMLIVPDRDSPDTVVHFIHTSVRDFLTDETVCADRRFFVDPAAHHARLARVCFQRMRRDLKPNICDFQLPSQTNDDVRELVKGRISAGLKYCCRSWSTHLTGIVHSKSPEGCLDVHGLLNEFCQKQLLNWLEVLSLTGSSLEAIAMAEQGRVWIAQEWENCICDEECNTSSILYDIRTFSIQFRQPIAFSARHISRSAMPYCPRDTELWRWYGPFLGSMPRVVRGPLSQSWPNTVWVGRGHSGSVTCVAFSPDGKTIVTGSADNTIRLWNTASGTPSGEPLKGHSLGVSSVAFSPDGKTIASGSGDTTICLWDTASGVALGEPLKGHSRWITSIAFSPDGKMLVSGSGDETIRLWDTTSGKPLVEPLKGHSLLVTSVTFSPDGKMIASGSHDCTIRLWDTTSGILLGEPLKGHSLAVWSVIFSPDGKLIASGSYDCTIRLWNPTSGTLLGEPLKGHSDEVRSVAFSPDGKMIASGSRDKSVRLWDTASGTPLGKPLKGHSDLVTSVAFSADGKMLVSGSDDETIRLWDTTTSGKPLVEPLKGHSLLVTSVAFSPDGTILASGSRDNSIRLWNPASGAPLGDSLKGHSGWVLCLAFSPDGKMLASGSADASIRLWNPTSGRPLGESLKGHSYWVESIAFSPDGSLLASGSGDNTVRLWNPASGASLEEPLKGHSSVKSVAFSDDGTTLLSEDVLGKKITRIISQVYHITHSQNQSPKTPLDTSGICLYDNHNHDGRMGWVFRDGTPWFWLPEEFWMDNGDHPKIWLSGNTIIISHRNIHILDVSPIV